LAGARLPLNKTSITSRVKLTHRVRHGPLLERDPKLRPPRPLFADVRGRSPRWERKADRVRPSPSSAFSGSAGPFGWLNMGFAENARIPARSHVGGEQPCLWQGPQDRPALRVRCRGSLPRWGSDQHAADNRDGSTRPNTFRTGNRRTPVAVFAASEVSDSVASFSNLEVADAEPLLGA